MSNNTSGGGGCLVIIFTVLVCSFLHYVGQIIGAHEIRDEAVKAGVAEYYLDANNEKQFRWKEAK